MANLTVPEYLQLVQHHLDNFDQVVVGNNGSDATPAMVTGIASVYNALGYCSGHWIRHCPRVVSAPTAGAAPIPALVPNPIVTVTIPQHRVVRPVLDQSMVARVEAQLYTRKPVGRVPEEND